MATLMGGDSTPYISATRGTIYHCKVIKCLVGITSLWYDELIERMRIPLMALMRYLVRDPI